MASLLLKKKKTITEIMETLLYVINICEKKYESTQDFNTMNPHDFIFGSATVTLVICAASVSNFFFSAKKKLVTVLVAMFSYTCVG